MPSVVMTKQYLSKILSIHNVILIYTDNLFQMFDARVCELVCLKI